MSARSASGPGAFTYEAAPGAPSNLSRVGWSARLKEWTGQPWLVATEGAGGGDTAWKKRKSARPLTVRRLGRARPLAVR